MTEPSALAREFTALLEITCFPNEYKDYERSIQIARLYDEFMRAHPWSCLGCEACREYPLDCRCVCHVQDYEVARTGPSRLDRELVKLMNAHSLHDFAIKATQRKSKPKTKKRRK